jgi:molecular chaperone DnaK
VRTAQRALDSNSPEFESHLDELRGKNFAILWRQDWFVIDRFKHFAQEAHLFPDVREHAEYVERGNQALKENDIDKLRQVVAQLQLSRIGSAGEDEVFASANIVRN